MVLASCQGNKCYSQTTRNFCAVLSSINRRTTYNQPSEHQGNIHLQASNNTSQLVRCGGGKSPLQERLPLQYFFLRRTHNHLSPSHLSILSTPALLFMSSSWKSYLTADSQHLYTALLQSGASCSPGSARSP